MADFETPPRDGDQESRRLWRLAGMGATMASEIAAGALIGWLLDRLFGTAPTLIVVCTIAGVVVGMTGFLRRAIVESRAAGREAARIGAHLRSSRTEDRGQLPTARLLAVVWLGCLLVGAGWSGVALALGRGRDAVVTGLLAAAVVGVAASVVLLALRPWRPKRLDRWPMVWVAGSFLRFAVTLGATILLYSATPYGTRSLWFAVLLAYFAVMVAETRVYASSMRRFAPSETGASGSE
jgi:F0F1-type ATP synthase assembly protein I